MTAGPRPVLLVSFEDPADVLRAFAWLNANFRCTFEDGGILIVGRTVEEPQGTPAWTLMHNQRADEAFKQAKALVAAETREMERGGMVPTLQHRGRHLGRPSPNQLAGWAKVLAWLLKEDPAGGDEGRRVPANVVIGALNDRLRELKLTGLLVSTSETRRFYNALRAIIPGVRVESSNRTYILGVDWTPEAREWRSLPDFRAPYASP